MALWLVRAGRHGEHEQRFLEESRIYLTWGGLDDDLHDQKTREQLRELLEKTYATKSKAQISASLGQIWAFIRVMEKGDWIASPSRHKSAIHFGEIKGDYVYDAKAEHPYYHSRNVEWFDTDIPRTAFEQDILALFNMPKTICPIKSSDAEARVRAMAGNNWMPSSVDKPTPISADNEELTETSWDLEQIARDQIAKLIQAKFKGHGMERLVDAVLRAQGYTTYVSPIGPDKGIDILAAPGPLGFGTPRICVQVKSGNAPLERSILDQLLGVMQNVQAEQGLLVSWGGFKSSIDKETANQFFRVRLWDQNELINQLLAHYEQLDEDLRAEIPLKRFWTIAATDETVDTDTN